MPAGSEAEGRGGRGGKSARVKAVSVRMERQAAASDAEAGTVREVVAGTACLAAQRRHDEQEPDGQAHWGGHAGKAPANEGAGAGLVLGEYTGDETKIEEEGGQWGGGDAAPGGGEGGGELTVTTATVSCNARAGDY